MQSFKNVLTVSGFVFAAGIGLAIQPLQAEPRYTFTDLGTLGGHNSNALGINDRGQIVGVSDTPGGHGHAYVYYSGTMHDLGTLGGSDSSAYSINHQGQIAGWSRDANDIPQAFSYYNGVLSQILSAKVDSLSLTRIPHRLRRRCDS